jgi:hypothetical protein
LNPSRFRVRGTRHVVKEYHPLMFVYIQSGVEVHAYMQTRVHFDLRTIVGGVVLFAAIVAGQVAGMGNSIATTTKSDAVDIRILTQQGLAIALASNVLQSQVTVLSDALDGESACNALIAGTGSSKTVRSVMSGAVTSSMITIYYDAACTHPYIEAKARMVKTGSKYAITEAAKYIGTAGAALGLLQVTEVADLSGSTIVVIGTGTFAPHSGAPVVHLGLTCAIPGSNNVPPPFGCEGGIAQTFPELGVSLGSVTPITLTLKAAGTGQYVVHFASSRSTMERGAPGALSIGTTANSQLRVTGTGTPFTTDVTTGIAGRFALFPPTPTHWTIVDRATRVIFEISVLNNASRQLEGLVKSSSGKKLASLSVDRSGTGSITYSGGATYPITNWLLSG